MMQTLTCHGPQKRATQLGIKLFTRADARLMGGVPAEAGIKPGHDSYWKVIRNA